MAYDHHPTLHDFLYEHGLLEWTDDAVADHYPQFVGPDGMPDWLALHERDHAGGAKAHMTDDLREVTPDDAVQGP